MFTVWSANIYKESSTNNFSCTTSYELNLIFYFLHIQILNSIRSWSNSVVFRTELLKQVIMKTSQEVESKKVAQDNVSNVWSKVANAIFRDPQSSNSYCCTLLQSLHGAKRGECSFGDQQFWLNAILDRNTLGLFGNYLAYMATKWVLRWCIAKQFQQKNKHHEWRTLDSR